ncbi:acyl-CoA N-acyltransferase [Biscogniauxia marginata]|nr:acyl-CoA N-acyltransferase [Biscogniauxia marginata]
MDNPNFILLLATIEDVPNLVHISASAFKHDTHTQMKTMVQGPGSFERVMATGLTQWIQSADRCAVLKAINTSDGAIVGFISWGFRGVQIDPVPEGEAGIHSTGGSTEGANPPTVDKNPQPQQAKKIASLERMTNEHLANFQKHIMPDSTRRMHIGIVSVDPRYHGVGIGSQLVKWGTDQADRAGVFCWVHSSDAGWKMFAKHGFREVERLTINMDQWTPRPPGEGQAIEAPVSTRQEVWGDYTFRYMTRLPAI